MSTDADQRAVDSARARRQAGDAARQAGVAIRLVHTLDEARNAVDLLDRLWRTSGNAVLSVEHLWSLVHGGNYAACAYDADTDALLAASVGFFASPPGQTMHSDVTGAEPSARDRGLGMALKLHQRAWALDIGLDEITWTFDPLMSRNAYFNLAKLGADVAEYCVDFYGDMDDGVNAGQGSDRLLASWRVADPVGRVATTDGVVPLLIDAHDRPEPQLSAAEAARVAVAVPRDILAIRADDPDRARAWRVAVRETLGAEIGQGARVVGFALPLGYIVERPVERSEP